jgi:hypothetical protein
MAFGAASSFEKSALCVYRDRSPASCQSSVVADAERRSASTVARSIKSKKVSKQDDIGTREPDFFLADLLCDFILSVVFIMKSHKIFI